MQMRVEHVRDSPAVFRRDLEVDVHVDRQIDDEGCIAGTVTVTVTVTVTDEVRQTAFAAPPHLDHTDIADLDDHPVVHRAPCRHTAHPLSWVLTSYP